MHFGEYMQSAEKDGKYFTRFVFVTPKTEIEGKDKATFTAHYNGNDYTFEIPKSTAAETQKSASTTTKATEAELNTDGENVFPDDGLNWSPHVPVD